MVERPKISLVLPAYNEVKAIAGTITEIRNYFEERQYSYEIIVSADGNDGTRELVNEMAQANPGLKLKAIGSVERCGKGHGIRQAMKLVQGQYVGFADADNKTPIEELDKLLPYLEQGYEVVIGSRGLRESQIDRAQPFYRRLGSTGFRVFMHTVTGLKEIADTQCGFKFFQRPIAQDLFSRQQIDGYMFDVEILYLAKQAGYHIAQVPIRWRDDGDSRLALVSGNIQNGLDVFKIRFRRYAAPAPARFEQAAPVVASHSK